jgi:hypothetical protein
MQQQVQTQPRSNRSPTQLLHILKRETMQHILTRGRRGSRAELTKTAEVKVGRLPRQTADESTTGIQYSVSGVVRGRVSLSL